MNTSRLLAGHRSDTVAPLTKRQVIAVATAALSATIAPQEAARADGVPSFGNKKDLRPARERGKVDKSLFEDGPEGLKQYDVKVGDGPICQVGDRAVVHFECKWKVCTSDFVNVLTRAAIMIQEHDVLRDQRVCLWRTLRLCHAVSKHSVPWRTHLDTTAQHAFEVGSVCTV